MTIIHFSELMEMFCLPRKHERSIASNGNAERADMLLDSIEVSQPEPSLLAHQINTDPQICVRKEFSLLILREVL